MTARKAVRNASLSAIPPPVAEYQYRTEPKGQRHMKATSSQVVLGAGKLSSVKSKMVALRGSEATIDAYASLESSRKQTVQFEQTGDFSGPEDVPGYLSYQFQYKKLEKLPAILQKNELVLNRCTGRLIKRGSFVDMEAADTSQYDQHMKKMQAYRAQMKTLRH